MIKICLRTLRLFWMPKKFWSLGVGSCVVIDKWVV